MPLKIIITTLFLATISQANELDSSPSAPPLKSILKKVLPQPVLMLEAEYSFPEDYDNDIHKRQIDKLLDLNIPLPNLTLKQSWGFYYNSLLEWATLYSQDNKEFSYDYSTPSISFDSLDNYYTPLSQLLIQGFMEESPLRSQMIESCLHSIEFFVTCCFSTQYFKTEYSLDRMGTPESLNDDKFLASLRKIYGKLIEIINPSPRLSQGPKKVTFDLHSNMIKVFEPLEGETEVLKLHYADRESRRKYNKSIQSLSYQRLGYEASIEEIHEEMYLLDWLYEQYFAPLKWSYFLYQKKLEFKDALKLIEKYLPFLDQAVTNLRTQDIDIEDENFESMLMNEFSQILNKRLIPVLIGNSTKS